MILPAIAAIPRCHWEGGHQGGWTGNWLTPPPQYLTCAWCFLSFPNPAYPARNDGRGDG